MNIESLKELLEQVKAGDATIEEALARLRHMPFESVGRDHFAHIDHHRPLRCGLPEVIYCPGKSAEQIREIFHSLARHGTNVLATRADKMVYEAIAAEFPQARYEEKARAVVLRQEEYVPSTGYIALITAGTSDIPVAEEARVTAELLNQTVKTIYDVGVAGLHRLLGHREILQSANVVIVAAGMEGALASVVGGLVEAPVIAVPTSVGYGVSFGGIAPLLTMLNSCTAGVSVVNIDNGFGAGCVAAIINRQSKDRLEKSGEQDT
ncbi:MAG: 1-(5-phosphoribosyl)-5-amino-4-imidazole-carboxylate carboxylase [Phycisphaerae bacterium SM23_30]|nr:MAG: 1-(5-phosphoribosyl)-5-amino-4-imidazole-carboxylate carboxylase [Phycisphaerae bacterium SM23_30]